MKKIKNPFSSSRVDSPFQNYPDVQKIYENEFNIILNIIKEIKDDENNQSKGLVIVGEAGSGKTHIIMRLANQVLKNNRLFFIRQPNNAKTVLYHIYNRILESFFEKVASTNYTQLEMMLGKTFSSIVIESISQKKKVTTKDKKLLKILEESPFNIYEKFGKDGTDAKRKNWKYIQTQTLNWWDEKYGFGGLSHNILKGLIKFCTYSDPHKKEIIKRWMILGEGDDEILASVGLSSWSETTNKEDFSLEAIATFGKLSLVDEPLILVFDQLEGLKNKEDIAFSLGEAMKEIFTVVPNSLIITNLFPDRWEFFQNIYDGSVIDRLGEKRVFLEVPKEAIKNVIDLRLLDADMKTDEFFSKNELDDILNSCSIRQGLVKASSYFDLKVYGIKRSMPKVDFKEDISTHLARVESKLDKILAHLDIQSESMQKIVQIDTIGSKIEDYFKETYEYLSHQNYEKAIFTESDDIGKLDKFIDAFAQISTKEYKKDYLKFGKKKLPENIILEKNGKRVLVAFLYANSKSFTDRLKNLNHLVLENKNMEFYLIRDARCDGIKGKVGKKEIDIFIQANNTKYLEITKDKRVIFDLLDKMIDDIDNKNFDIKIEKAIKYFTNKYAGMWLVELF